MAKSGLVKSGCASRYVTSAAWRLAALGLAILACFASAALAEARSLALVIGNNEYKGVPTLQTAVGDARAVGDELEKIGFVVRRAYNVDQRAMSRALAAFDNELQPGDRALFFYAGHGFEISGANYLLPTDVPPAQNNQLAPIRDASFPVERVIDDIRARGVRATVLVLDACRDNPFAPASTRGTAAQRGLAKIDAPEGVFVLMSAGAKQGALDHLSETDGETNSVFTRTFLRELGKPGRTMVQIAKATQIGVRDLAKTIGEEQTPAYYDEVVGDLVLYDDPAAKTVAEAPPPAEKRPPPAVVKEVPRVKAKPVPPAPDERQQVAVLLPDRKLKEELKVGGPAPIASFMRSNAGWSVTISLPEPATAMSYRLGGAGEFKSTGLLDVLDQRTGQRMPNTTFPLPAKAAATIIEIRYETADGGAVGPFPIRFDPDAALFREQKQILEGMPTNWVSFRDFNGTLVYFTTLVTYRCAIAELRYGLDEGQPLQRYDLPPCNANDPFSVPGNAKLYMKVPPKTKAINLQITWRDGTQSEISTVEKN